jgi:redox-sensitive bicupin YhaK (pirin superfamily)
VGVNPSPATVSASHVTDVGGLAVHRALPQRARRTVGAWCFLDRFGPIEVTPERTMKVGPHPHIGLHTVTWLLAGQVLHSDSLGNRQLIRPGQLNLMTSGHGIAHAEDGRGQPSGAMDGVQLWVAQPERTRHDPPSFAHHAELPTLLVGSGTATVLIGTFGEARSPAQIDSPLVGVDLTGSGRIDLPLDPGFEYGLAVLHGGLHLQGQSAAANQFVSLGGGQDTVALEFDPGSRVLLLGGEPLGEEILMWWNFVGRNRGELEQAGADWNAGTARFGPVDSTLNRIEAPRPFWH